MTSTVTCPNCYEENAYFNGVNYECPDCDYEWGDNQDVDSEYDYEQEEYERLISLKQPYFTLEQGRMYECGYQTKDGKFGETTIIPLSLQEGQNRQFILAEAAMFIKQYPEFVKELIKMDFITIWNGGLSEFPSEFETMTVAAATNSEESYLDDLGMYYRGLRKIDGIQN